MVHIHVYAITFSLLLLLLSFFLFLFFFLRGGLNFDSYSFTGPNPNGISPMRNSGCFSLGKASCD